MRRSLACLVLVAVLGGCGAGPVRAPGDERAAERIRLLETQIAAGEAVLDTWGPWYAELARINSEDRAMEPLFLPAGTEIPLFDPGMPSTLLAQRSAGGIDGPVATILDVARQLRAAGIDLLLVPVPPRAAVYPELFAPGVAPLAPGELPPLLDWRLRGLYLHLERSGVEVLDLLPAFLASRSRELESQDRRGRVRAHRELLYMSQDPHWSPYASTVAAKVIAARVRQYPWFPEMASHQGRARVKEGEEWVRARGATALKMVDSGTLDAGYPREGFMRHTAWIDGEQWSNDDRASPILVIGDSYAMPRWCLPDQLLVSLRLRVDVIAVAGGFQSSQLRALRLRGDGLEGKRLVIWEICAHSYAAWVPWMVTDLGVKPSASTRK